MCTRIHKLSSAPFKHCGTDPSGTPAKDAGAVYMVPGLRELRIGVAVAEVIVRVS
jgi:hypothetical protein